MPTCLITGASGFIGSRAVPALRHRGWTVHAISRHAASLPGCDAVHAYDGTQASLNDAVSCARPDVVIHLATCFIKDHQPADVPRLIAANIAFGTELLEAMRTHACRRMVTAGTAWQHTGVEDGSYLPANLYAATKQAFEDILRWYASSQAMAATSLHFADTYGPDDPRPKIFRLLAESASSGQPLDLSPGGQELDPLHVDDAAHAVAIAADRDEPGFRVFRASPGCPVSLRRMVDLWCASTGLKPVLRWGAKAYRPNEVMRSWQGGEPLPGWRPAVSLEAGFRSAFGAP